MIDGNIARDFPGKAWFIEIADLDALLAFTAKNGAIRLVAAHDNDDASGFPKIEVHEDYE